jgi:hypothetical protein
MRISILLIALCATTAHAEEVSVVAAPGIAAAPASGLDPDVAKRLADADRDAASVAPAALGPVIDRALVTFESTDPFSVAQRPAAKERTVAVLTKIGERARAAGEVVLAARAFDARWTIGGGGHDVHDVRLAETLTTWAERDADSQPGRALYLARRARSADPGSRHAADLDDSLSRNHRALTGKFAMVAGFVALAAGIYMYTRVSAIEDDLKAHPRSGPDVDAALADRDRYDLIGTGLLVAAPVVSIGGFVWMMSGNPSYSPVSPGELPALVQR